MQGYELEKKAGTSGEGEYPYRESKEVPGSGLPEDGAWNFANPIVRRPDVDRQDFKGAEAFVTITTVDISASVKEIQAKLIRVRAPTHGGGSACWDFKAFERKSTPDRKLQTVKFNLNEVDRDFFRYKKWPKKFQSTANLYFVVIYFFGFTPNTYARAASPTFEIIGRTKSKKRQKTGAKRKPEEPIDLIGTLQDDFSRVEVTPLSLDMEPKAFCDLVEARQGLTLKAWIDLVQYLVSKKQINDSKTLEEDYIPLCFRKTYKPVDQDVRGYSSAKSTGTHFYGLMKSFAVPKEETKSQVSDDNLVVTARNLLVVLEFFRPFRVTKYTVADCLNHMTKNLADYQGCCAWWYHGLISKEEVYKILYDEFGQSKLLSRSFCVRFRHTESQSMSIIHYRLEHDGPKWKERFIMRSSTGYRLEDLGYDKKPIEIFERPTVGEIIDELSNPLTRGERVLVYNSEVVSKYHLEDLGQVDFVASVFEKD